MKNKKQLITLELIHKIVDVFSSFFLNIYLFKISGDDFNFILLYTAIGAIFGCVFCYFLMKALSPKTANFIFRSSYVSLIISILMLLIFKDQIINFIWIFLFFHRYAKSSYYAVYEQALIGSSGKSSINLTLVTNCIKMTIYGKPKRILLAVQFTRSCKLRRRIRR